MTAIKILVIEDDEDILTVLCDQLELDGYDVVKARSGEEGLKGFERYLPDLVILDLNLPDIDGIKICQRLRHISDSPVIILTARDSLSDKIRGFDCGCDDYIVKPFEYLELKARIKACLRRKRGANSKGEALSFGPLKVILRKREVFLNGKPVHLTKKEFDLLEILVTHPDQVLERDYLCTQLWPDNETYSWSRALDVHIRRLRLKVEPDPDHPSMILTHPGVGYRFNTSSSSR